jgi:hypothetical protein
MTREIGTGSRRISNSKSALLISSRDLLPKEITDLEAMAASGIREPLAHSLFREAQRASGQREYASSLVMAIAALEIGVKQLIGTLVPVLQSGFVI